MSVARQVVAIGGGGCLAGEEPVLEEFILGLCPKSRPRVLFLPTASGDSPADIENFYRAFTEDVCRPHHLGLFSAQPWGYPGPEQDIMQADIIYAAGGCCQSLIGVWKAHDLPRMLTAAYRQGTIMSGVSAGAMCWFDTACSSLHGQSRHFPSLGLLPYCCGVHYHEPGHRREALINAVLDTSLTGYAADDHAAMHFLDERLHQCVTANQNEVVFKVTPNTNTEVAEERLPTRRLS